MSDATDLLHTSDDSADGGKYRTRAVLNNGRVPGSRPGHYGPGDVQPSKYASLPLRGYVYRRNWEGGGWSIQPVPYQPETDRRGAYRQ